ncbi:MAG: hypothetical protein M3365_08575 [Gemmatimonadota bacterium]|nr:hypothetical protein [Gemmatimonadota bacterium]
MLELIQRLRGRAIPPAIGGGFLVLTLALGFVPGPAASDPAAAQDSFIQAGDGWATYVNERFGTSLAVPADFTPAAAPENGDGRRFTSEDATLEVYAWDNVDGETAGSLKSRLIGSEGYSDVTYSPSGRSWLVVSGYRGDNIFYEKYFFRGDTVHGFGMEFPSSEKPYYEDIVEEIEDSFRAGWEG